MLSATHLHAMIVHFPIALLMAGFLSEVISLFSKNQFYRNAAFYLLVMGSLGSAAAFLSGSYAGEGVEEGPLEGPIELHENAALLTLWLSGIVSVFYIAIFLLKYKAAWTRVTAILLFAALIGSLARTGYLGGHLVYNHGAGVELTFPDSSTDSED
ncbi:MAG: DUF2231 domain-containing protein [Saprospiraceae bacterium]|uniref:DUF2231 domain-containing protein n=1 Tax=Candidatus Opimibacter skivensis TaxID=2982028 RepID=A0A9D7XND3_9BACT|nr:DUF2231 domain-containing protein [Candidatus Opimibacter skivensis]